MRQASNRIDLTGKRFGHLTVVCPAELRGKIRFWKCRCDCGVEKSISGASIRNKTSKSCGCKRGDMIRESKLSGFGEISGDFWYRVKRKAKERGLKFTLKISQVWEMFERQNRKCAISGIPISFSDRTKSGTTTASLDRIDSKKGYLIENVQWVHKDVNMMKQQFPQDYFIELCKKIGQNNDLVV